MIRRRGGAKYLDLGAEYGEVRCDVVMEGDLCGRVLVEEDVARAPREHEHRADDWADLAVGPLQRRPVGRSGAVRDSALASAALHVVVGSTSLLKLSPELLPLYCQNFVVADGFLAAVDHDGGTGVVFSETDLIALQTATYGELSRETASLARAAFTGERVGRDLIVGSREIYDKCAHPDYHRAGFAVKKLSWAIEEAVCQRARVSRSDVDPFSVELLPKTVQSVLGLPAGAALDAYGAVRSCRGVGMVQFRQAFAADQMSVKMTKSSGCKPERVKQFIHHFVATLLRAAPGSSGPVNLGALQPREGAPEDFVVEFARFGPACVTAENVCHLNTRGVFAFDASDHEPLDKVTIPDKCGLPRSKSETADKEATRKVLRYRHAEVTRRIEELVAREGGRHAGGWRSGDSKVTGATRQYVSKASSKPEWKEVRMTNSEELAQKKMVSALASALKKFLGHVPGNMAWDDAENSAAQMRQLAADIAAPGGVLCQADRVDYGHSFAILLVDNIAVALDELFDTKAFTAERTVMKNTGFYVSDGGELYTFEVNEGRETQGHNNPLFTLINLALLDFSLVAAKVELPQVASKMDPEHRPTSMAMGDNNAFSLRFKLDHVREKFRLAEALMEKAGEIDEEVGLKVRPDETRVTGHIVRIAGMFVGPRGLYQAPLKSSSTLTPVVEGELAGPLEEAWVVSAAAQGAAATDGDVLEYYVTAVLTTLIALRGPFMKQLGHRPDIACMLLHAPTSFGGLQLPFAGVEALANGSAAREDSLAGIDYAQWHSEMARRYCNAIMAATRPRRGPITVEADLHVRQQSGGTASVGRIKLGRELAHLVPLPKAIARDAAAEREYTEHVVAQVVRGPRPCPSLASFLLWMTPSSLAMYLRLMPSRQRRALTAQWEKQEPNISRAHVCCSKFSQKCQAILCERTRRMTANHKHRTGVAGTRDLRCVCATTNVPPPNAVPTAPCAHCAVGKQEPNISRAHVCCSKFSQKCQAILCEIRVWLALMVGRD